MDHRLAGKEVVSIDDIAGEPIPRLPRPGLERLLADRPPAGRQRVLPPAGSTVIPIRSPGRTADASSEVSCSRPAERAPDGLSTQTW